MAKELEAEDIELKEYSFTPKEFRINGITVLDYTEVENDKVFLCNKKDILDKPRPSWIPELDSKGLAIDKFLPICVKDFSDGNYFVQSKIYTGEKDSNGKSIYKNQIYKMSPDVLAATVDYYLKRKRAELKTEGSSEKVSLPRGMNSMPTSRYNEISKLCLLCDVPSLKYKNIDKSITDKAFEMKGKSPGKLYQIQNNVVFLEQWQPLLENIKGKRLDMNYQKQDYIDSYSKAVETAYGDSKTFNNLYNDFGIKIKKQNGTNFSKPEIEKLSETLKKVYAHYGNLSELAGEYGLKISYADNCMQFARKAIGLFTPFHNAIGISFFNEEKQLSVAGINHLPDVTLAHEVAHWLDSQKGKESHNFFASDKYGTLENQIATKFKEEIKLREKSNKSATRIGKADEIHLGEYWHRTCECFARAMEQYYALKQGIDLSEEIAYARKDNFEEDFIPLIEELMEENKRYFNLENNAQFEQGIKEKEYTIFDAAGEHKIYKLWGESSLNGFLYSKDNSNTPYSEKNINDFNKWLKEHSEDYVRLYHGTSAANRNSITKEGLKRTTLNNRHSYQSTPGYVYLLRFPTMARTFGEFSSYRQNVDVYAVDVQIKKLKADLDQINNKKNEGLYFGDSLAASLLVGSGARCSLPIPSYQLSLIEFTDNDLNIKKEENKILANNIEEQNTKVKGEYLLAAEEDFMRREEPYKVVDAYSISTKSIYDNVIKRLDSEGYVCRTQLKISEYRTPSFSELDEYIKENSKKYQPVIVLFDEYNDYDKTTNEYKTIKAWQIYDKESLENGTYISLGKCKINYLNENLELEYKGPFVAPGSQITARSYYNSKGTRELCHVIKEADRNSEEYKNAIEKAASYIAEHIHKSRHTYLVPAPNHNGKAEYTYDIARIVGLKINAPVFNILECKPHETLYEQKKKNLEPDVELFLNDYGKSVISNFPEGRNYIYLIDNCISTGLTFNKAAELINGLIPAVYAIGNFAEVKYVNEKYKVNNLLELKNEITHEENKLMENENIEVTEQMKKDSDFLRETYSNKKAVDSAVKKASIIDFVSKDENRYFMTGVYYENGFAVATNGRVLIKLKTNYPSEYEGKIINPSNGKEIDGQFPNYKKVFPKKEDLVDRSDRLAHITDYLSSATMAVALSSKNYDIPVIFGNTLVRGDQLQTALAFARDKGFNKVLQEDNFNLKTVSELDEKGKEVFKYYNITKETGSDIKENYRHKYYSFDELPDDVKEIVTPSLDSMKENERTSFDAKDGSTWYYDKVEKYERELDVDPSKPLNRAIEFDHPDGSSILVMPLQSVDGPYIDKEGVLRNYEDVTPIKVKLLGKGDDFYKNVVRTLVKDSDFSKADIDSLFKKNYDIALEKQNPAVFPKDKKDCLVYATTMSYADALGESFDKNNVVFTEGQTTATWEQFVFNMYVERVKDLVKNPSKLFLTERAAIDAEYTIQRAKEENIIQEKVLPFEEFINKEFGTALEFQVAEEKTISAENKKTLYSFIVKDNAEFGSDFEPVKNLSAKDAVKLFQHLNESDVSENRFGIALEISGDKIFGEWAEDGISIVTLDEDGKANFGIFGDTFIKQLKEADERSRTYIDAYKELYNAFESERAENSKNYEVVKPDFIFEKEKELFSEHSVNENKTIGIKPVTLEEILDVMDMRPDYKEDGSFMIYDIQKQEYISSWVGWEDDNGAAVFKDASEAFERLDIYINDYYIHDMQEQLEAVGVEISGNETLSDLCNLYKAELEKGNTKLSEGELNLAMGIVEPDTVTYEHKLMKEKPLEKDETNELRPTVTLFASASEERITELKEHLSQNGYDVKWIQIEDSSVLCFTCDIDSKAYIQTILEERGIDYSYKLGLLASGYDASWLTEDEQLDAEVVTEEEFKRINEIREKEFKDLKLPYIKIDFTEGTTSSHKPAMMESGTVLGLKEGEELLNELNRRFNTFLKCNVTLNFPDAKDNEPSSYQLRYDFEPDFRTLENGKKVPFGRDSLSEYIRMTCSYPEVLEKFEEQWQKVNAPDITDEQKKIVSDIINSVAGKLEESYKKHLESLKSVIENDKKLSKQWIISADVAKESKEALEKEQDEIAVSFKRYAGLCVNHIADYLNENKEISFKDELVNYAYHQLSNMLQNVKYGESRNAHYGDKGYDFDFSLWRKSLEKVMDSSEYKDYFINRLQIEQKRSREIRDSVKDMELSRKSETLSLGANISVSLKQIYDYYVNKGEVFLDNEGKTNFVKTVFGSIRHNLDDGEYYDLYSKEGELLCCDGETVSFEGEAQSGNLIFKNNDVSFSLSKDEFELATKTVSVKQVMERNGEKSADELFKESVQNEFTSFDFKKLADVICQKAYEASASGFNYNFSFDEVAELAGKNEAWVKDNLDSICDALSEHNDELLLDFSKNDVIAEDNVISFNFCSVGEDSNELFKKDESGRWIRKTDRELAEEQRLEETYNIKGERYSAGEIEESLKADLQEVFKQLDSGDVEENLTLKAVRLYGDPSKDGAIRLLAEFESKNPEKKWREDSLFDAINEEKLTFNGLKVDVNPITADKSGTIEEYLERLEGFSREEELIKANAKKLEEKEIEQKLDEISDKLSGIDGTDKKVLPFSIINYREKGRVNIKFDTVENNPQFSDILKELRSNGWKYAPSTKQWYPVGKAVNTAEDFANKLQEKYTASLNPGMEKPMDIGSEKSPYDGIRFFDRNYNEAEEFARYFNNNLHLLHKDASFKISEEDASTILKAIGYENNGIIEQRKLRIGLDAKENIVILTKVNGSVETQKTSLDKLLVLAKEKSLERVEDSKQMLKNYLGKESAMKKDLQDIFVNMYETCVEQSEDIDSRMNQIYDSFYPKEKEVSKAAVLYQRNSYRGWEISADKDFKKSVYCRPFDQMDRSGYIIMAGKEGTDGFWQEKFVEELLHTNNHSNRSALIETFATLMSDSETCAALGIENPQSVNGFLASIEKIIKVENGADIKEKLLNDILGPSESKKIAEKKQKMPELTEGIKIGEDTVIDSYKISDGVYQATLSREINGAAAAQNYFVIADSVIKQLSSEKQELTVSFDGWSVIENKTYEPYILRELIAKQLMPPRDEQFVQKLDDYIEIHPLKYEKLKPVDALNFERKLQEIAEVDKSFNKTPFELGQQLMALVDDSEKPRLNKWLISKGCDSRESMAKVFESWLNKKDLSQDRTKQKNNGYPPRGDQ